MQLNPYLLFNGQCEKAFKFYEQSLGAKIDVMIPYAGTPAEKHGPPEWRDKILHARLMVDGEFLMGSDAPPDQYRKPSGFSVSLNFKEPAEAERIFSALSQQGTVKMPIQETFWALRFGMLVDQFDVPWTINCEKTP